MKISESFLKAGSQYAWNEQFMIVISYISEINFTKGQIAICIYILIYEKYWTNGMFPIKT